jgi:hypothetical protein
MTSKLLNKKVILAAILAVGAVSAILVAPSIAQASVRQHQKMMWTGEGMPQINGSINVANETNSFVNENVKVSFITAAETAQGQAADGKILGGHLGVVQGYLAYMFFVANTTNQTGYLTVIDAGNGEVLYTSEGQSLGSFGHWYGHGGHGYEAWHGNWKGHGWGMWS